MSLQMDMFLSGLRMVLLPACLVSLCIDWKEFPCLCSGMERRALGCSVLQCLGHNGKKGPGTSMSQEPHLCSPSSFPLVGKVCQDGCSVEGRAGKGGRDADLLQLGGIASPFQWSTIQSDYLSDWFILFHSVTHSLQSTGIFGHSPLSIFDTIPLAFHFYTVSALTATNITETLLSFHLLLWNKG